MADARPPLRARSGKKSYGERRSRADDHRNAMRAASGGSRSWCGDPVPGHRSWRCVLTLRRVRFCVEVEDEPRELFRIEERPNGAITLLMKTDAYVSFGGQRSESKLNKISLHPSPKSATFNMAHLKMVAADDSLIEGHLLTDAIKKKTGFTLIYVRRAPDLSDSRFCLQLSELALDETIVVGKVSPTNAIFFHAVCIGSREIPFSETAFPNVSVSQSVFKTLRVIVLHTSALTFGSNRTGSYMFPRSIRPESVDIEFRDFVSEMMRGRPDFACASEFLLLLNVMMVDYAKQQMVLPDRTQSERLTIERLLEGYSNRVKCFARQVEPAFVVNMLGQSQHWSLEELLG